jgi:uncharacterized membrane protein
MSQPTEKTTTGMQPNLAGLLCYLVGWVTGIVFLIIEKENKFVRFHAVQSIVFFGAYTVVEIILEFIPVVGWILAWLLSVFAIVMWIILMYNAYQGKKLKLPIAGEIAEKQSNPVH